MMKNGSLRSGTLSFAEVLAASIALIGLTMTPVLIAPVIYAYAGNATWFAYAFAGLMLIFVALNLNQFTRRESATGSMYNYAADNLGWFGGAVGGWSLIWAYVFVGAAVFGALGLFGQQFGAFFGHPIPVWLTIPSIAAICWYLSYRDIALSTIVMLVFESASVLVILTLIFIVFTKHPLIDPTQFTVSSVPFSTLGIGIGLAIFGLVGFESATAFGEEAHQPLIIIPRAVIWSVVIATLFFVLATYSEVVGLHDSKTTLDKLDAPLGTLSDLLHVGFLRVLITIGAIFSAFSVALACVNTAARIMMAMASRGLLPKRLAFVSPRYGTPVTALLISAGAMLALTFGALGLHVRPIDIFGYGGTLSSFGFIVIYGMIAVAAPLYLKRIGELRKRDVVISAVAVVLLLVPLATLFYPVPPPPSNWFVYWFVGYLVAGTALIYATTRPRSAA
ncbi:MAG: APC family permease [Candidatus Eremiobacteraeota bacterium]|nr:APC family permease [Candidatus Eremiobacteraeota bacterium]